MNEWYQELIKPPFNPPSWVFTPVWTALYASIAVSVALYLRTKEKKFVFPTLLLLCVHLAMNFIWTYLFFGLRSPLMGLIDIVLMVLTLIPLMILFYRTNKYSCYILIPYLIWLLFAGALNLSILVLNP